MNVATESISPQSSMKEVLAVYPGAQRALFRKYHIGGCSSCGFQPTETLAEVCDRNGHLDVAEVLSHIRSSHEQDAKVLISPKELAELIQRDPLVKLVDVRSREEFEAVLRLDPSNSYALGKVGQSQGLQITLPSSK